MYEILRYAIEKDASDVHITENMIAWIRVQSQMERTDKVVQLDMIDEFIKTQKPFLLEEYKLLKARKTKKAIDGAFWYADRRFRINTYLSIDGTNLSIRLLREKAPSLEELFLPPEVKRFTNIKSGLYIVSGATGSGKSTTLAAFIRKINEERSENIITLEDPIEYIHRPIKSRIVQIEVGLHAESFDEAIVSAMRQNPNIIFVGEMRNKETIQNAINLAETGHVVYGTLHAKSAIDSVERMIGVFSADQQEQIRLQISKVLRGVLHQTLIKSKDSVVPLAEQMVVDEVVASMILGKQKPNAIRDHLRSKGTVGNHHIVNNAVWHISEKRLTPEDVKPYLSHEDYNTVSAIIGEEHKRRGIFNA